MLDYHYAERLGRGYLDNFDEVKTGYYRFSCPYCGDSKKKYKRRGNFYTKPSGLNFRCFNCNESKSFSNFLKDQAPKIYNDYIIERYKRGLTGKGWNVPDPDLSFFIKGLGDST